MLATPSRTPETVSPVASSAATKITRGHSCVLCQQRKVKCDRQKPCANCVKARAECVVSAPTLPRRRRRKLTETDLVTRLRRYEQLLKTHGVKLEEEEGQSEIVSRNESNDTHTHEDPDPSDIRRLTMNVPRSENAERGALFFSKDSSQYVEDTLWENLRDEIQDPQGSSEDDINDTGLYPEPESFLMGFGIPSKDMSTMHPPVVHIFRLWQIFLDNVNPLVKMFHAPTVQQTILDASGDLENISKPNEALMFSIYFLAISSLTSQDCEITFGEPKQKLLSKYTYSAQQALVNARFLKSLNLTTLQALTQFLIGARRIYDPNSIWILSGVAVRIAQRLGIHRETTSTKLPPFDTEMRRRTWWQIVFLDGHASKLAGAGFPAWVSKFDTKVPLNVSDSELSPSMKELPRNKEGATEMLFCCMRYEVVEHLRNAGTFESLGELKSFLSTADLLAKKDKAIAELEKQFQHKYVRHCDPSIPLHLLVIYVAQSVICTMKIMSHHPRQYPDKGASMPQRERDFLFMECLREVEIDTQGHEHKPLMRFLWHIHVYFQLDAFIYILSELRTRLSGDLVERAWSQVEQAYTFRPELISDTKNSLYVAIGNLTLKAWAKREEAMSSYQVPTPRYISLLRTQRNDPDTPKPKIEVPCQDPVEGLTTSNDYSNTIPQQTTTEPNPMDMWSEMRNPAETEYPDVLMPEVTPVDWEYWQRLMDGDLPAYSGEPNGQDWF